MSDSITGRVTALIESQLCLSPGSVDASSTFEGLGIDSLTGLNLVYEVEKEFGIEVPNEQVLVIRGVREIVDCLRPLLGREAVTSEAPARSPS